jgi:hypothetical protein
MSSTLLECPHCGAEKVGINLLSPMPSTILTVHRRRILMMCPLCEEGVIGIFEYSGASNQQVIEPMQCNVDPTKMGWRIINLYPKPQPSKCPNYTPDDLKRIFLQAANALKRGDPDASGAMSRKVVDVSLQQRSIATFGEDAKKYKNIFDRIEALAVRSVLTPDLKDWAHQVRLGGADAAHDADLSTPAEAEELLDFAELYLTYVYTLPGRLNERREQAAKIKAAATANSN